MTVAEVAKSQQAPTAPVDGVRLIVFDCDGTLVDSQHSIVSAMAGAYGAHGLPAPSAEAVRQVVGLSLVEAVAKLSPDLEAGLHESIAEGYKSAFRANLSAGDVTEPLFPGAIETLRALNEAGYLLGVATGKSRRGMERTIAKFGLEEFFVTVQTADGHPSKPHPAMLEQAMADVGAAPHETVLVGDTTYDIVMARSARAHGLGVTWGYHAVEELRQAGAAALVEAFEHVPPTVAQLLAAAGEATMKGD